MTGRPPVPQERMTPEELKRETIRHDWLDALRGKDYRQGMGWLAKDGKFCCLGVLCEVVARHGVQCEKTEDNPGVVTYDDDPYFPSSKVLTAVGVGRKAADNFTALSDLNDDGESFATIADHLESGAFWVENQP